MAVVGVGVAAAMMAVGLRAVRELIDARLSVLRLCWHTRLNNQLCGVIRQGGAIYIDGDATVTMSYATFSTNSAVRHHAESS